ncbi:MAG: terminase small subunit [Alcaligenaceae bacterium]|nr:MAG: terminase small subunit [Alcaligenaceae bacterium]
MNTAPGEKARAKTRGTATKVSLRPPNKAKKSGGSPPRKPARASAMVEEVVDIDVSRLPLRQQLFVSEFVECGNGTQAAIRAGYLASDAASRASKLLANPTIGAIVQARVEDKIEAVRATRDHVLQAFADIVEADANELSQYRRVCCRHCHGPIDEATRGRVKLFTPAEWIERRDRHDGRRGELIAAGKGDIGDFAAPTPETWYDNRRPINTDCPECFGDGVGEVFLMDTRTISRRARALLAGVKQSKDGVEIKTHSKESALAVLARHHRLYDEGGTAVNVVFDAAELDAKFGAAMRASQERMEKMRIERRAARDARIDNLNFPFVGGLTVESSP